MSPQRLAWLATLTLGLLVVVQAAADPSGLLSLVGWTGADLWPIRAPWQIAPFVVYLPVLLGVTWWAVRSTAGSRWLFTAAASSVVLAVMLAKFAMSSVAVHDIGTAAWGAGFAAAKALPAALIVAGVVAVAGRNRAVPEVPADAPPVRVGALVFGAAAPVLAGQWWAGAPYDRWMPAPNPMNGLIATVGGVAVLVLGTIACHRVLGRRISGGPAATFLAGWFAAMGAGILLALTATIVGLFSDDGFAGDLWPLMSGYIRFADGVSYGACTGWIVGLAALWAYRRREQPAPVPHTAALIGAVALLAVAIAVPLLARPDAAPTATASPAAADAADTGALLPLRVSGEVIADSAGREVLLRGVNVNQLVDFYAPRPEVPSTLPLTDEDFAGIADHGFNVVRLALSWSALEPEPGRYDEAYLDRIELAVAQAKAHGLYTVLDMHQDGWSNAPSPDDVDCRPGTSPMWGYDGAPEWATITDGAPRCQFTGRDISPAGGRAFTNFYYDTDDVQEHLVQAWAMLAGKFKDEPAVAGYDLLNEPNFGESAPLTSSLLLGRFYDRTIDAIRAAGAEQIVYFEPSILWSGLGFDSGPPAGFTDDRNIVFSPHLYAESITMDASLGLPTIVSIERGFTLAERVADKYGVPVWTGEYGYWGDGLVDNATRFAKEQDAHAQGGAYWVWKQSCGDPQNGIQELGDGLMPVLCSTGADAPRNTALLDQLTRAYPRFAPGRITHLAADGNRLELTGRAGDGSCRLEVWFPHAVGTGASVVDTFGIDDITMTPLGRGTLLTGCATGDYEVHTDGA
ncbi:glycoside hydrolase family 5 protein [Rhodococcus sp. BE178]|uniref:glycoside hydrolase family 5 protein n=1 Tax=Rhodococcus sp. BE178 TaxID=2817737 RepID=UPI003D233190